jgi:protein-S-isoprenylcysteine O-methyltransferase Ste14
MSVNRGALWEFPAPLDIPPPRLRPNPRGGTDRTVITSHEEANTMADATEPELRTQSDAVSSGESDRPNVLAPPPLLFCGALALGLAVHLTFPVPLLPGRPAGWLGVLLILTSIPIGVSALRALVRAKTAIDPRKPTTAIVTEGVFRFSRNPIYLSLLLLYLALASLINSLWILLCALPAIVVLQRGVVEREERYLERRFGEKYLGYKNRVRRWI